MEAFLTAFGLSGSAGLNAYLPLLLMGLMSRLGWLDLAEPYNLLASDLVLAVLTLLLLIEMVADKVPAVDSANDVIQTAVRPTSGALLFASSTSTAQGVDPTLLFIASLVSGGISAGAIHSVKAFVRPGVTVTTGGTGNFIVSIFEDVVSFTVSIFAVLLPYVVLVLCLSLTAIVGWWIWDMRRVQTYFGEKPKRHSPEGLYG